MTVEFEEETLKVCEEISPSYLFKNEDMERQEMSLTLLLI